MKTIRVCKRSGNQLAVQQYLYFEEKNKLKQILFQISSIYSSLPKTYQVYLLVLVGVVRFSFPRELENKDVYLK